MLRKHVLEHPHARCFLFFRHLKLMLDVLPGGVHLVIDEILVVLKFVYRVSTNYTVWGSVLAKTSDVDSSFVVLDIEFDV